MAISNDAEPTASMKLARAAMVAAFLGLAFVVAGGRGAAARPSRRR